MAAHTALMFNCREVLKWSALYNIVFTTLACFTAHFFPAQSKQKKLYGNLWGKASIMLLEIEPRLTLGYKVICLKGNTRFWSISCALTGCQIAQPWIFTGRADAEAEAPIPWLPDAKSQLIGKDPDAGKDWRQEEKGLTEDELFGWHHQLDGHESAQTLGDGEGQGRLVCCSPRGHRELDRTE